MSTRDDIPSRQARQDGLSPRDAPRRPLAYRSQPFLESDDARPLRILAEYLEPKHLFERERIADTIVFFASRWSAPDCRSKWEVRAMRRWGH